MQLATVFVIFVSVSLLFATWLLQQGMRNGLEREQERLGADLLVVPDGVTVEPGEILYGGAPQNIYMPKEAAAEIQSVPGVEGVSVQFFGYSLAYVGETTIKNHLNTLCHIGCWAIW